MGTARRKDTVAARDDASDLFGNEMVDVGRDADDGVTFKDCTLWHSLSISACFAVKDAAICSGLADKSCFKTPRFRELNA